MTDVMIDTEYGPASVETESDSGPDQARFLMVLTHGAGGGVDSADLLAEADLDPGPPEAMTNP